MNRPLVFYGAALFMGALGSLILFNNVIIGAVFSASFLSVFYFTKDKKDFIIIMMFFILGVLSYTMYFNIIIGENAAIRITDKKNYYFFGDYKGRKVIIKGNLKGIEEGDKIIAEGTFKTERNYKKGIIGTYTIKSSSICKKDIISTLYSMKKNMFSNFKGVLGEKNSALLMALCFGETSYLTNSQMDDFNKLGVIHAISVSGFHMALIYGVMEKIIGLKAALPAAFLYALFTGCQAATMRAFIMIFILKLSTIFIKNYDGISSLCLAAMVLLLVKPWYIGDIGFMLSFLSTLGIILYYKKITRYFYRLPEKLNETLSISISAQLFSLPFTAFTLQKFSPGFLLGNFVLLPFYSILVLLGNAALLISFSRELFNAVCGSMAIVLKAIEGADYILLKFSPEVTYFSYLQGSALLLIYLSFVLYIKGHKQTLFYPVFVILFLLMNSYSFFPKVNYMKLQGGRGIIINYKAQCVMVCNYDSSNAFDIHKIKEEFGVTKVVSNINSPANLEIGDMKIKAYPKENINDYNDIKISIGSGIYDLKGKLVDNDSDLYVIILNRLFHLS
ncbi:MAG: ComEC/Rec2 family competence protein [Solirubrobacterales bacterium]